MPWNDNQQKADLLDRYVDAIRKVDMAKKGEITLNYDNMEILTIGKNKLTPAQYRTSIEDRYQKAFASAVIEGQKRFDAGTLRYPIDIPEQLQVGLFADNNAREKTIAYNRSLGLTEGPGQLISMNRWAYDMNGSGDYAKPDLFIDFGPGRRYWVDGKSSFVDTNRPPQFKRFFDYTGASGGKVATKQGMYEVNNSSISRTKIKR